MRTFRLVLLMSLLGSVPVSGQSFVNWESPHVNAIDMTPNGAKLLVANTADNRMEVFEITAGGLVAAGAVPVGLDPVSVQARSNTEIWVVNHISDSVSIVDLNSMTVTATLLTGDEPTDVVFAGSPQRAFVSVSQRNQIFVFDPANLLSAPTILDLEGEDPRALVTDGTTVFVAIYESGNKTTILAEDVVTSALNPYPGDVNPPPNDGVGFNPLLNLANPVAPGVSLIVRKNTGGAWVDDHLPTPGDWSAAVPWDLHDHDVAMIQANTLAISYVTGLMNLNMNLAVGPGGNVFVIGTDAINNIRYEPNVSGTFVRVMGAKLSPPATTASSIVDLNPHLTYTSPTVTQALRDQSIGDPRGIDFSAARNRAYIAGMGSNNLIVTDLSFARVGRVEVGQGPTSVQVDDSNDVAYVLNKFEGSISIIDLATLTETDRIAFHDPTPQVIRDGRPHLYDTHRTSGLGQTSCGSCHIDGRMDQIAWDLGDPSGVMKVFNQTCDVPFACEDFHPMKGPMATQTLIGIIGTEPFHWRGDRENLAAFNGAFISLLGDDVALTPSEMSQFTNFVATLTPPPNPNRNLDNTLRPSLPTGGNPQFGANLYNTAMLDGVDCNTCHSLPTGTNGQITPGLALQETQSIKIPQLRNMYEKTGFFQNSINNNRGFGFIHDGSVDTLFNFLLFPGFQFSAGAAGVQERQDVEAFLLSLSTDTHAGVGAQATMGGSGPVQIVRRNMLIAIADSGQVGLVAKGNVSGEQRGYFYLGGGSFQSDRALETVTTTDLDNAASDGAIVTYTLVPLGSQQRIGVDRDGDSFFDGDELDLCSNPADAADIPGGNPCPTDIAGNDSMTNVSDLLLLLAQWGQSRTEADIDCSGDVNVTDLLALLAAWGPCV